MRGSVGGHKAGHKSGRLNKNFRSANERRTSEVLDGQCGAGWRLALRFI